MTFPGAVNGGGRLLAIGANGRHAPWFLSEVLSVASIAGAGGDATAAAGAAHATPSP